MDTQKGWFFFQRWDSFKKNMAIFLLSVFDFWGVSPIKTGDFEASHLGFQEGSLEKTHEKTNRKANTNTQRNKTQCVAF